MKLPLEVCQQFGQFAYQDEQKGVEAIAAIQDFMDEYQDGSVSSNESQEAKVGTIERDQAGVVTVAKSVKLLPNVVINLKGLIKNTLENLDLKDATNLAAILSAFLSPNRATKMIAALRFIQFAIGLTTVELKQEQAGVLVALHHLSRGELQLEIPLAELQAKMRDNYHFSLDVDELDNILKELRKLRCISRRKNRIYLTEKIILKES
jgi:hypothetical protein